MSKLADVARRVLACRSCPRLRTWCEDAGRNAQRRFAGQTYHARPVPGFGDERARIVVIGLAPSAHGANRTGRMFTGDQSGVWLYGALHGAELANQSRCDSADDGLRLRDVYITAACRCAPPANRPSADELKNCSVYLDEELEILWARLRVIVVLGEIALIATWKALRRRGIELPRPRPEFEHGVVVDLGDKAPKLVMSYHPSQQNTFTRRLSQPMFDAVWEKAKRLSKGS